MDQTQNFNMGLNNNMNNNFIPINPMMNQMNSMIVGNNMMSPMNLMAFNNYIMMNQLMMNNIPG